MTKDIINNKILVEVFHIYNIKQLSIMQTPTPLYQMQRLEQYLKVKPKLFVKRDDLTGVGMGGNKVRKLSFILADALAKKADTVITCGGVQSNHCRQTALWAAALGLECHLILTGDEPPLYQGNLLIDNLAGAKLHFIGTQKEAPPQMELLAEQLTAAGRKPYQIPLGGSNHIGVLGYKSAAQEIAAQGKGMRVLFDDLVLATGSGGTQAGLILGVEECLSKATVHGVSVSREQGEMIERIEKLLNDSQDLAKNKKPSIRKKISVFDGYIGEGYAKVTSAGLEAIKLFSSLEGIILDPVYTGKAAAGFLDLLQKGFFDNSENVLFIHTGGFPANFAFADHF